MKSIKEKAKLASADPFEQEWFETGANCVLDAIEEFMRYNLVCNSNLKRLIEQLKGNQ